MRIVLVMAYRAEVVRTASGSEVHILGATIHMLEFLDVLHACLCQNIMNYNNQACLTLES